MQNVKTKDFVKKLKANGFKPVRQKGSHATFYRDGRHISIPITNTEINGTVVARLTKENNLK